MKLGSIRELSGMKPVLKDPHATGPDPVYWVFPELSEGEWANMTVWNNGTYNGEFPKTFGHYHPIGAADEIYRVIWGKGILQLQRRHNDSIAEVFLVHCEVGDEVIITWPFGHSWSNVGDCPLITYDNWRSGHDPSDYEPIEAMQGMAYYLIEKDGEVKAVPNPKYKDLPEPVWITAEEFKSLS